MRRSHILLGATSIVAAGVSSVMISNYLERAAEQQAQAIAIAKEEVANEQATKEVPISIKTTSVLVTSSSIDVGDSVDDKLIWLDWPEAAIDSITSSGGIIARQDSDKPEALKAFVGAVARLPIPNGRPVNQDMVVTPGTGSVLAALIRPGMRAITISIDHTSVGGMLQPGDNVDAMLTVPLTDQGSGTVDPQTGLPHPKTVTETIIRRAHVLSVDRRMTTVVKAPTTKVPDAAAPPPTTVTLELSEHDASRLTMASQMGRITLALTPLAREKGGDTGASTDVATDVQVMPGLRAARVSVTPDKIADLPFPPPAPVAPIQVDNDAVPTPEDKAAPKTVTIYHWTTPARPVPADGGTPTGPSGADN